MIRIEFLIILAWFQTPQNMFRGSKTPRREGKQKKSKIGFFENDHLTSVELGQWVNFGVELNLIFPVSFYVWTA